jgi:hypothetical protein
LRIEIDVVRDDINIFEACTLLTNALMRDGCFSFCQGPSRFQSYGSEGSQETPKFEEGHELFSSRRKAERDVFVLGRADKNPFAFSTRMETVFSETPTLSARSLELRFLGSIGRYLV